MEIAHGCVVHVSHSISFNCLRFDNCLVPFVVLSFEKFLFVLVKLSQVNWLVKYIMTRRSKWDSCFKTALDDK